MPAKVNTRIIHTKIWRDPWFRTLDQDQKVLFIYLITNPYINILHLYELGRDVISKETGLSEERIQEILQYFNSEAKINSYKYYIHVPNAYKYQEYTGIKNNQQKLRTMYEMSDDIIIHYGKYIALTIKSIIKETQESIVKDEKFLKLLERVSDRLHSILTDTPIHTPMDTKRILLRIQNTEYRNKNTEIRNPNTEDAKHDEYVDSNEIEIEEKEMPKDFSYGNAVREMLAVKKI